MAAVDTRYATALAEVVREQGLDAAAAEAQLKDFYALVDGNAELREVMMNPSIPEPQKLRVLDGISGKLGTSKAVRNFIAVVMHHERLAELNDMIASFHTLADAAGHVAEAEITSAHPLDDAAKKLLEQKVADLTGGERVHATYTTDASLLGGAVIKVGSTVYDGSVRAQLEQMKQRLVGAA